LIYLRTRPGVFSHRELDGGARALIKSMAIAQGMRVLDLGCGSGAVSLSAAVRAGTVEVDAIDSNPRAVEATRWAAERNMAASVRAALDCDGSTIQTAAYGLVVTNPPYYSDFRIPTLFLNIAARALCSGGIVMLVTKSPQWYADHLPMDFAEATLKTVGNYVVLSARRL
jgi:23S rRNA (guanine1835-N2)-methyltransferase